MSLDAQSSASEFSFRIQILQLEFSGIRAVNAPQMRRVLRKPISPASASERERQKRSGGTLTCSCKNNKWKANDFLSFQIEEDEMKWK